jgi:hypothetical protein
MTLLDRLKPQYKDLIDQKNDKFPTLIGIIYDHLESEEYLFNLKWGVWIDIKSFTNADSPYDVFKESNY